MPFALEIENRVDKVLHDPGAGYGARFRHVADDYGRYHFLFGEPHKRGRAFPHLGNGAGRAAYLLVVHDLDGVHQQDGGFAVLRFLQKSRQIRLRHDPDIGILDVEPFGAHLGLGLRFLAGNVEHFPARLGQRFRDLQKKRRFSDAGIAAHQKHLSRDQASAADAVEFADLGWKPLVARRNDRHQRLGRTGDHDVGSVRALFNFLLHEGVPGFAGRALPQPFRRLRSALLADVYFLRFSHLILPK